jgi:hypothetical protein
VTLLLKLVLAPMLVVASSLAGRRWGPGLAGALVALPIVAGPILFITYLEQGRRFVSHAASASLLGLVSLALFAVVFALLSRRRGWTSTLVIGWSACLVADLALSFLRLPAVAGLFVSAAATGTAMRVMSVREAGGERPSAPLPWWDLPARAVATGGLVLALTAAAARLGPGLTGVLAPFPTGTSVVAAFALVQGGSPTAVAAMRGVLRGLWGFAVFCFLTALLAEPLGGSAFVVATAGALGTQLALRWISARPGGIDRSRPTGYT